MDRITVTDVRKTFQLKPGQSVLIDGRPSDRVTVLNGIDLTIRKGEFITLVGPSGSGKIRPARYYRRPHRSLRWHRPDRWQAHRQAGPEDRLCLPAICAVSLAHRSRQYRICARGPRRSQARAHRKGPLLPLPLRPLRLRGSFSRTSSRAACSSAWRSPARLRPIPKSC